MATKKHFTARIKCYDNGGKTIDRYTVIYLDDVQIRMKPIAYGCVCMNERPFHPQGFGQHGIGMPGRHLGKKIDFEQLPLDCQKLVKQDMGIKD